MWIVKNSTFHCSMVFQSTSPAPPLPPYRRHNSNIFYLLIGFGSLMVINYLIVFVVHCLFITSHISLYICKALTISGKYMKFAFGFFLMVLPVPLNVLWYAQIFIDSCYLCTCFESCGLIFFKSFVGLQNLSDSYRSRAFFRLEPYQKPKGSGTFLKVKLVRTV
jgi:hypothetical protein